MYSLDLFAEFFLKEGTIVEMNSKEMHVPLDFGHKTLVQGHGIHSKLPKTEDGSPLHF